MTEPVLILASASPRREQLLRQMGLPFRVVRPHDVQEILGGAAPDVLAAQNAQRKAHAVAAQHPDNWVLAADTIVVVDDQLLGKPADRAEATRMLQMLAGRAHTVITGVCLVHRQQQREILFTESSTVWMKSLNAAGIAAYLDKINPLDKAGGYAAQEYGETIIERIEGSFTNVMGLPVERLQQILKTLGWRFGQPTR